MSVKLKIFKNMAGMCSGDPIPSIEYSNPDTEEFEKYLSAARKFEEVFEIEEMLFDWDADIASYRMMMQMANDIDAGRVKADQLPVNYQQNVLQMREMAKLIGATMPGVSLEIRTKGTDWHQPIQIFFADHPQEPRGGKIILTKFELETLTASLEKQSEQGV
jgi:hypothetical protein